MIQSFSSQAIQSNIFDLPKFDGKTIEEGDEQRLGKQYKVIFNIMKQGSWWTPEGLEMVTGFRWSSINARIRDMHKEKFGSHTVNRKSIGRGLFMYQLIPNVGSRFI